MKTRMVHTQAMLSGTDNQGLGVGRQAIRQPCLSATVYRRKGNEKWI